jgi:hypothetical protein
VESVPVFWWFDMGKVVWEGEVGIGDGEKVFITVRRNGRLPNGKYDLYAEGSYDGEHFSIDDNGIGIEHVKSLVVLHCSMKKTKFHPPSGRGVCLWPSIPSLFSTATVTRTFGSPEFPRES